MSVRVSEPVAHSAARAGAGSQVVGLILLGVLAEALPCAEWSPLRGSPLLRELPPRSLVVLNPSSFSIYKGPRNPTHLIRQRDGTASEPSDHLVQETARLWPTASPRSPACLNPTWRHGR